MTATPDTLNRYVLPLSAARLARAGEVGRKAAFLGELLSADFPVPDGFVLTTAAWQRAGGATRTGTDRQPGGLPDDLLAALAELGEHLGDAPVAVRSSGVSEDLAGSSFAGQYESYLDVRGTAALVAAVKACWASARSERVAAYSAGRSTAGPPAGGTPADGTPTGGTPAMAVVVQHMVPADTAGVVFSANPVTGDRDEVVLSAVRGLGDQLVAGRVSPEEWTVRDGEARRGSGATPTLSAGEALRVAELARQVEAHFGEPQDIEWAAAGGRVWLVQARPITALPEPGGPAPLDVPPGSWVRDAFSRRPWTPLQVSIVEPILNQTSSELGRFGLAAGMAYTRIGGWTYSRIVALEDPQQVQDRIAAVVAAVGRGEPLAVIAAWHKQDGPRLRARSRALQDADLAPLDGPALLHHLATVTDLLTDAYAVHFRVAGAGLFCLGELGVTCSELLGWTLPDTLRLVTGLPSMTTEPVLRLAELAVGLRAHPDMHAAVRRFVDEPQAWPVDAATQPVGWDRLTVEIDSYRAEFCHRLLGVDLTEQPLSADPRAVLAMLRDLADGEFDPAAERESAERDRAAATAEARRLLAGRSDADRARFERALYAAGCATPARDDKAFVLAGVRAVLHDGLSEAGRRLADAGVLAAADDVFFLDRGELKQALGGGGELLRHEVADRRGAHTAAASAAPPLRCSNPPAEASPPAAGGGGEWMDHWLQSLPETARPAMSVVFWVFRSAGAPDAGAGTDGDALAGVAASAGRYTGPVRVVHDETEFDKLRPGDVLVCPETTPQWSMLFPKVGALVTDTGGLLSHPAIIAREYRVPAVLAVSDATSTLQDGQLVTVDGTTGRVELSP